MENDLFGEQTAETAITVIRPLSSDPNMRSVRAGGKVVARLRAVDVETLELRVGQAWTRELAAAVDAVRDADAARRAAFKLLGRRARSVADVTERLERAGHPRHAVERVVAELVDAGWLDDEAYARDAATRVEARRPAGRPLIVEDLRRRGIDEDLADRVARERLDGRDEIAAALDVARPVRNAAKKESETAAARRIARVLARRGFDEDTVRTALHRLGLYDSAMSGDDRDPA